MSNAAVGSIAPTIAQTPIFGYPLSTEKITEEQPLVLLFLRYSGSSSTRAIITTLHQIWPTLDYNDIAVVAVVEGDLDALQDLVPRYQVKFPVVHGDDEMFNQFGVGYVDGLMGAMKSLGAGGIRGVVAKTFTTGRGFVNGNMGRLPAIIVVGKGGQVVWRWDAQGVADEPDVQNIADAALNAK